MIEKENEDDVAHDNQERKKPGGGPRKSGSKLSLDSWGAAQGGSGAAEGGSGPGGGGKKRKVSGGGAANSVEGGPGASGSERSAKKAKATSSRQSG